MAVVDILAQGRNVTAGALYTTVMQITILRAEWKTLGGLLTLMHLSIQQ